MAALTLAKVQTSDLRARRIAAGLSQQALATEARCSIGMVRQLEAGAVPRHSAVLGRVLQALAEAKSTTEAP